ncbi:hypothetical protein EMCRGX_G023032 [Ephydatia muelleri]
MPLQGRDRLSHIPIEWESIKVINVSKEEGNKKLERLLAKYPELKQQKIGTVDGKKAQLNLQEGATPTFMKGLYGYHRLPFGVSIYSYHLAANNKQVLQGIRKMQCMLDDIIIARADEEEHFRILEEASARPVYGKHRCTNCLESIPNGNGYLSVQRLYVTSNGSESGNYYHHSPRRVYSEQLRSLTLQGHGIELLPIHTSITGETLSDKISFIEDGVAQEVKRQVDIEAAAMTIQYHSIYVAACAVHSEQVQHAERTGTSQKVPLIIQMEKA